MSNLALPSGASSPPGQRWQGAVHVPARCVQHGPQQLPESTARGRQTRARRGWLPGPLSCHPAELPPGRPSPRPTLTSRRGWARGHSHTSTQHSTPQRQAAGRPVHAQPLHTRHGGRCALSAHARAHTCTLSAGAPRSPGRGRMLAPGPAGSVGLAQLAPALAAASRGSAGPHRPAAAAATLAVSRVTMSWGLATRTGLLLLLHSRPGSPSWGPGSSAPGQEGATELRLGGSAQGLRRSGGSSCPRGLCCPASEARSQLGTPQKPRRTAVAKPTSLARPLTSVSAASHFMKTKQ